MEQEFLKDIVARLERTGVSYAVTGSIASNLWGIPRTTHDVDVVVVLSLADVDRIIAAFVDRYYLSQPAVQDAVSRRSMFNIIDSGSPRCYGLPDIKRASFIEHFAGTLMKLREVAEQSHAVAELDGMLAA